ncbi:head-tail connector protein [Brevibacillus laterosporus]|uniref:head-tail connector protein n=1 Tax=Brevibacillus laterosporus TaxID=1465 RepID=UPI000CE5662B|nr:head-tail connector protein [Brevibacillus laterosporus]AYB39687.1 phage gp6-like head-tail connector protein [Brevibacillus laterosporus]MBM7109110.1 Phage gp6-like head-tail connector protein [Brevibacillus laterosporus]MED1786492.1 head-tail connector protein [Brevibacillus laterosporus]PPA82515.1 phage gp6-like head-tail connector protein [Brevibacillus laterosporus]
MPTLEDLKTYLRIDGSEDDGVLALLMEAAREYLTNAGVPEQSKETSSKLYDLAVMLYVTLHFENRDPAQKIDRLNFAFESIILQLKAYK